MRRDIAYWLSGYLFALSVGMGLGRSLTDWLGVTVASGVALVLAISAFLACVYALRPKRDAA